MRRYVLVGFARSGTMSISKLFHKFGIRSLHQSKPSGGDRVPVDLDNPQPAFVEFARKKVEQLPQFEAAWDLSKFIYLLEQFDPDLTFLIMTRDPVRCANSMLHHFLTRAKPHTHQTIEHTAKKYDEVYTCLIEQALRMRRRPRYLKFEKYVQGAYNEKLLGLFDIPPTPENLDVAADHLTRKLNSKGEYKLRETKRDNNVFPWLEKCQKMRNILQLVCDEF